MKRLFPSLLLFLAFLIASCTAKEIDLSKVTVVYDGSDHPIVAQMAQTLADACIVMTACQFPEIRQVEISSEGFWSIRPASRTLSPEQLELDALLP